MATVEAMQFTYRLHGRDPGAPVNTVDWDNDSDWPWHSAARDTPEQLYAVYNRSVATARADLAEALAHGDPGLAISEHYGDGPAPSIRRLLVDAIEEYARHTGHADLSRESIDGLVGEDPSPP